MRSLTQSSAGPTNTSYLIPPSFVNQPPVASSTTPSSTLRDQALHCLDHPLTPPSVRHFLPNDNAGPHYLSPRTRAQVTRAIKNGWAKATVKRYSSSVELFLRFCDEESVPEHLRFPADEFVLCAFAASSLGRHARSTVSGRLSGLKAWHFAHNMEWKGSSRLRYVLNGVHTLAPGISKRPPRPPITAKMLIQLVESLDLTNFFDLVVAACAVTAFWGQCRLGELIPASLALLLSILFPTRASFVRSLRNPEACLLRLPHTKTHQHGQDVVLVDQVSPINPIRLLKAHLRLNNIPHDSFIFSYRSAGVLHPLTKSSFLRRCNQIWSSLGYPHTSGHCFRIGGTTELLIAGIPPDVVRATGRWSSGSFLRYWRSLDDIAPRYMRYVHSLKRKHARRLPTPI
jgi:hypothetical protein